MIFSETDHQVTSWEILEQHTPESVLLDYKGENSNLAELVKKTKPVFDFKTFERPIANPHIPKSVDFSK